MSSRPISQAAQVMNEQGDGDENDSEPRRLERLPEALHGGLCRPLLDHRRFPLLRRVEYFILRPAYLRHLKRSSRLEPQLPVERGCHQTAGGLELLTAFLFVQPERIAEVLGFAVPVRTLRAYPDSRRHY